MSKHLSIIFKEENFWSYDVITSILLKFLIDSANNRLKEQKSDWLLQVIEQWRINAIVSDFGFYLDDNWTEDQLKEVREIIRQACQKLSLKPILLKEEIEQWTILDNHGVDLRGEKEIRTEAIVELAKAIDELLNGTLPEAPKDHWWFYGPEGQSTIKKRS